VIAASWIGAASEPVARELTRNGPVGRARDPAAGCTWAGRGEAPRSSWSEAAAQTPAAPAPPAIS